jgi:UDP-N-acetylglucosamine--N-acetylmuramyl-(pentapeptide) pyrophosphoryl-undecaprenol N-acetylglucosamine transferase
MKVVVTGGGSGGHITPLLAVAHELKQLQPNVEVIFIGQKGDSLADVPAENQDIDSVHLIRAGKFRRYHGEGAKQLLDLPTLAKNVRDAGYVVAGIQQARRLLKQLRPDVIFVKGGFVGVPVGLAASALKIPYVTHDSDAMPGLANRIIARGAAKHAVGLPKEIYDYPPDKTVTVGVPLSRSFKPFTAAEKHDAREQIGVDPKGKMILVTGGGNGALRLNNAVAVCVRELLDRYKNLTIVQIAGRAHEASLRQRYKQDLPPALQKRVIVKGFVTNMYLYSGAADVVVTRAGATIMAELAAQGKACVVVPNPQLTGGHQVKNAKVLAERSAIRLVTEDKLKLDDHALMPQLVDLIDRPERAVQLGKNLGRLAQPDAAKHLAMLLLEIARS